MEWCIDNSNNLSYVFPPETMQLSGYWNKNQNTPLSLHLYISFNYIKGNTSVSIIKYCTCIINDKNLQIFWKVRDAESNIKIAWQGLHLHNKTTHSFEWYLRNMRYYGSSFSSSTWFLHSQLGSTCCHHTSQYIIPFEDLAKILKIHHIIMHAGLAFIEESS